LTARCVTPTSTTEDRTIAAMRTRLLILGAALLTLAVSACAETQSGAQISASDRDPTLNCPSGFCEGMSSARYIGGNGSGF